MPSEKIIEYLEKEEKKLQRLFNDYRLRIKEVNSSKAIRALHALLAQIQEHAHYQETEFFPLSEMINNGTDVQTQIGLLRKDHESMCELISTMLKEEEEGIASKEEQEAFHVLLVNHFRREEDALSILDQCLTEKERQTAISLEVITR